MYRNVTAAVLFCVILGCSHQAWAWKQVQDPWFKIYLEDAEADADFQQLAKKQAKCYICHQGKKSKKNRNPYGAQLAELLEKKDKKDKQKIIDTIKKVGLMHTDPKDETSPTYDEVIASGKLPGGELEELKKEPKK